MSEESLSPRLTLSDEPAADEIQPSRRADGMPVGKPFARGHSGNKRGRPKGVKASVLRRIGENGEKAVDAIWRIVSNPLSSDRLRLEALTVLLDRGFGRPAQTNVLEGGSELKPLIITTFGGRYKDTGRLEPFTVPPPAIPAPVHDYSALAEVEDEPQEAPAPVVKPEPVAALPVPWQPAESVKGPEAAAPAVAPIGAHINWLV